MFQSELSASASKAWIMFLSNAINLFVSELCLPSEVYLHSNHHAIVKLSLISWGCSCFPVAGDYRLKWTSVLKSSGWRVQGEAVIVVLRKGLLHLCQDWLSHYSYSVEVFVRDFSQTFTKKRGSSNELPVIHCMTQPRITFSQHCLMCFPNFWFTCSFLLEC